MVGRCWKYTRSFRSVYFQRTLQVDKTWEMIVNQPKRLENKVVQGGCMGMIGHPFTISYFPLSRFNTDLDSQWFACSFWSFVGLAASEIQDLQVGQLPLSTIINHNQAKVSTIILLVLKVSSIQVHAICSMLWLQPTSVVVKIHVFGLLHKLYLCKGQCHVAFNWCFILEEK